MTKKSIGLSSIPAVIALLITLGVLTVCSACGMKDDGTWMHCHSAQNAVAVCGGIMTVLFAVSAFLKNRIVRITLNAAAFAAAVIAFLLPGTLMPMCMMYTMRCYTVMQPFVRIMTVLAAIFAVWNIVRACKQKTAA